MAGDRPALPEIPASRADDLRGIEYMDSADLVLFMAGNQFMVMDELLGEFRQRRPGVKRIFCETLPPGLEFRQILAGGAVFNGTVLTGRPDVYTSVAEAPMLELKKRGMLKGFSAYLGNRLVIMVPRGNPAGVASVKDLARDDVRVSQPGEMEDITAHIARMYRAAGGEELAGRIMEEKRAEGTTLLTVVHHRETPLRLLKGTADAGPVWYTELVHARARGLEVEAVEVGPELDQRGEVRYFAAELTDSPNPGTGRAFFDFLMSGPAQDVFERHGFVRGA